MIKKLATEIKIGDTVKTWCGWLNVNRIEDENKNILFYGKLTHPNGFKTNSAQSYRKTTKILTKEKK